MARRSVPDDAVQVSRRDVLAFRMRRHGLDRAPGTTVDPDDLDVLDLGIQDTGPDGAPWALAIRGVSTGDGDNTVDPDEWAMAWTLRGAPHLYRRADLAAVAVATAPFSEADAAKRIFDAATPLRHAGIPVLDALATVADHQRDLVTEPTVKGDLSSGLTSRLDEPFLRFCRSCDATHIYEQPFRLAALQAGLELVPGTSPPVLRRSPGIRPRLYGTSGADADPRVDVVRVHLRCYGPTRPKDVAAAIESPAKEVTAHWPDETIEVMIADLDDGPRAASLLAADTDDLAGAAAVEPGATVRLLGPYDPYLQLRDRELLVPDEARRKDLWRVLGRPGAIVDERGEVIGTWRPKSSGDKLTVRVDWWGRANTATRTALDDAAQLLADHRGVTLAGISEE